MHVPEINKFKADLEALQSKKLIKAWELPYENLLTRISAAIFFLTPIDLSAESKIWNALKKHGKLKYSANEDQKLSTLKYRVTVNEGTML